MGSSLFITTEELLELKKKEEEEKKLKEKESGGGGGGSAGAFGKEEPVKETTKEPKFITTAEMLELKKKDVPSESTFDYLNSSIEKNYTTAMKLEKELSEFDTSMVGIPDEFKPSFVSNYNKRLTDFNTLVSSIKDDIGKRDEIIKNKNMQIFIKNKHIEFNQPQPEDKPEPTWGNIIKYSLKSGLGQYQASLVNLLRLVDMGVTKLTDPINKIMPINDEKVKAFEEKYGEKPDTGITEILTKIVEDSEKIATESQEQAESKQWLKKLIGTGLQSTPQILGAVALGGGMPIAGGIAAAKPTAEIAARVTQMIPFGLGATGGHARNIEKEFEALGKEAPYLSMVAGGLLGGAGEMATELPIFMGITKLLKGGGKALINKGAKTLVGKYGKLGIEFLKDVALQAWQEAEMEPIERAINKAVGLPQDLFKDLVKDMGTAAYGGLAMALVLGGLGGGVAGSVKVASKTVEAVDNFMQNKDDIRGTLRKIAELEGIIPTEPEAVALTYKVEPKEPNLNNLKKELAGRMTEERIFLEEIEKAVGKKIDVKKPEDIQIALDYVKKIKEVVEPKEELKAEGKPPPAIEIAPTEAVKAKEPAPKEEVGKVEGKEPVIPSKEETFTPDTDIITKEEKKQYSEAKAELLKNIPKDYTSVHKLWSKYTQLFPKESYWRAIDELRDEGLIKTTERKLRGVGEWIGVKKAEVKPPTIEQKPITPLTKVPTTITEAKEILKVDPKKPLVSKDKLAEQMVANKVSLADIEAVKGEKIDVTKPKDIIIALRDIKAVKKEVVEPTPKVESKVETTIPVITEGQIFYHGTSKKFAELINKEGVIPGMASAKDIGINEYGFSISPDKNFAKEFSWGDKGRGTGIVLEFKIMPNAKIATPENLKWQSNFGDDYLNQGYVIKAAKEQGFDVVDLRKFEALTKNPKRITELQVLNPKVIQLVTPTTEKPAVVEAPTPAKAEVKAEPTKPPIPPSPPTAEMAKEPIGDPIAKLNELIKKAKPLRGRLETAYTKERAKRIREVERVIDEVGGEKGYIIALSKLKGELAPGRKTVFEPIKDKLSKPEVDSLYNRTFKHPYLDEWEKISAANELTKLLSGELPTPKGLVLLEEIYGTNLMKSILAKRALGLKITDVLIDIANIPRAILATADMSAFLRQGIIPVVSHPIIAAKAIGKTFRFAFSPKAFDQYFKDLTKDKLYPLMRKSGLAITDPSRVLASGREEAFFSRLMQQTPIVGHIIKFAERSYVGFLNKLRVDVFKTFADEFLSKGYSPVKDKELFKATAEVVNTFTGRGSLGNLNRITPFLNTVFFSPRLIMARFNALNPVWYTRMPKEIRIKAICDFGKFVATGLTLLAIIKASDLGDVEDDPRSSDFGKIKIGNTRWDIWGGFIQWCRVFAQLITGQRKNTATGEIISLSKDEYPFTTRKEVLLRFIEGKLAPVPALINELISGAKTFEGEEITFETVAREKFIPMYIQDITEAYMDGGLGRAVGAGTTAFFGVGVQTWQEKTKKTPMGRIDIRKELTGGRIDIRKELGGRIDIKKELGF